MMVKIKDKGYSREGGEHVKIGLKKTKSRKTHHVKFHHFLLPRWKDETLCVDGLYSYMHLVKLRKKNHKIVNKILIKKKDKRGKQEFNW